MHRLTKAEQGKDHSYTYDDVYRLTHSVPTPLDENSNDMRAEGFTFDPIAAGHRTSGPDNIETYLYGQDNRLDSLTLATPLVTPAEDHTYTYDYENRLTGVVKVVGTDTTTVTFKYDPFGRRIQKRVQTVELNQNVLRVYTYIYDNEDVILERLTEVIGGVPTTTDTRYVHGPGIDEPLAIARGSNIYFYHADGQGSIVALTSWTEATVEGYNYDTFGNVQRFGNAVKNTYAFTGREYDEEIGLYYYRARYYDPETGRFISKDPIGFAGGDANLYNYVLGDPVNWGDPWGLWVFAPEYGTTSQGLRTEIISIESIVDRAFNATAGRVATITYTTNGRHIQNSLHYSGYAIDLRTRDLTDPKKDQTADILRRALGDNYDVIVEPTHIHLEYDPHQQCK